MVLWVYLICLAMTDNVFEGLRSIHSKPYHYYKVVFTVINRQYDTVATEYGFISSYFTLSYLDRIMYGFDYLQSIRSVFSFSFRFIEVRDNDRILFHHIKDRSSFERFAVACFLQICADHKWHLSFSRKVIKFLSFLKKSLKKPSKPSSSRVFMFN